MSTPSLPRRRLYPEQRLFLALMALVMAVGLNWGLPDQGRLALLSGPEPPGKAEQKRIFSARDAYYQTLDTLQAEAGRLVLKGQAAPLGDPVTLTAVLSQAEKDTAWRAYLLGSAAVDERYSFSVLSRMNPAAGDFNPRRHNYGGSFIYPLGGLLYLQKLLGVLNLTPDLAYYLEHPGHIAQMYRSGRCLSVLAFLGGLYLLGRWGLSLGGRAAASLAMLAYGVSSVPFWQALVTKPHLYAACSSFLGLYLLARFQAGGRPRLLILSAAAMGWAMGASLPAGAMGLAYPILLWHKGQWRWLKQTILAGLVMLAVYLLSNPYVILSPETFAYTLTLHGSGRGFGYGVFGLLKMREYLHDIFIRSYAFPLGILGGVGALALLVWGKGLQRRLALLFVALTLLVGGTVATPRITLFTGPLLCLLAGLALERWLLEPARPPRALKAGLLAVLLMPGLFTWGLMSYDALSPDSWRGPTQAWLAQAGVTPQTSFGSFGRPDPTNLPPFPFLRGRLVNLFDYQDASQPPDYVILGNFQGDPDYWRRHPFSERYRLVAVLGYRDSWDWLASWRHPSEARLAAWVYQLQP